MKNRTFMYAVALLVLPTATLATNANAALIGFSDAGRDRHAVYLRARPLSTDSLHTQRLDVPRVRASSLGTVTSANATVVLLLPTTTPSTALATATEVPEPATLALIGAGLLGLLLLKKR